MHSAQGLEVAAVSHPGRGSCDRPLGGPVLRRVCEVQKNMTTRSGAQGGLPRILGRFGHGAKHVQPFSLRRAVLDLVEDPEDRFGFLNRPFCVRDGARCDSKDE